MKDLKTSGHQLRAVLAICEKGNMEAGIQDNINCEEYSVNI